MVQRVSHLLAAGFFVTAVSFAADPDTLEFVGSESILGAARTLETHATAPFAVAFRLRSDDLLATEPGLTLQSVLRGLPGILVSDRGHYALGERLLIRGMGFRSSFGVRSVQVVLDGVPLTMPDGQTITDIVDPAFIRRAELIRGPSSLYWGNASSGVLFLSTSPAQDTPALRLRAMGGSYGLKQFSGSARFGSGQKRFSVYSSAVHQVGYRDHSAGGFIRAGFNGHLGIGSQSALQLNVAAALQDVESPGPLTPEEALANPRQASPPFIALQAGKRSGHFQGRITLYRPTHVGLASITAYSVLRRRRNSFSFEEDHLAVDMDRIAGGVRLQLRRQRGRVGWGTGLDASFQWDDHVTTSNNEDDEGIFPSQYERVHDVALFGTTRVQLTSQLSATVGARIDGIRFALDDRLMDEFEGDKSGKRNFRVVSPSVGVAYKTTHTLFFANVRTAFETPIMTERINRPDGASGFNDDLNPQRTVGFEIGARGLLARGRLEYDIAAYRLRTNDRFQEWSRSFSDSFLTNEGSLLHQGVEISATFQAHPSTHIRATWSGGRYSQYHSDGFKIRTLVPEHSVHVDVETRLRGFVGQLAIRALSDISTIHNTFTFDDGYATVDVYAGHTGLTLGRVTMQPFVRVRNILDASYNALLVHINFGYHFEPAAGRTIQMGVNVAL